MSGKGNSANGGVPLIGLMPQIVEAVADTTVGFLAVALFVPMAYGIFLTMQGADAISDSLYVLVFWSFWEMLLLSQEISWPLVIVIIIFASFLIGCFMRHPFWLITAMIMKLTRLERVVSWLAYRTLRWDYKGEKWLDGSNWRLIKEYIIKAPPFSEVGDEDYARFRSSLMKGEGEIAGCSKYWEHEEFLYFLHNRAFSVLVTFNFVYLVYAIAVACLLQDYCPSYPPFWVVFALMLFFSFTIYRGMLFHGCAFVTVNNMLRAEFNAGREKRDVPPSVCD